MQVDNNSKTLKLLDPKKGLLGPQDANNAGRICLILDLDETLVHSSFQVLRRFKILFSFS